MYRARRPPAPGPPRANPCAPRRRSNPRPGGPPALPARARRHCQSAVLGRRTCTRPRPLVSRATTASVVSSSVSTEGARSTPLARRCSLSQGPKPPRENLPANDGRHPQAGQADSDVGRAATRIPFSCCTGWAAVGRAAPGSAGPAPPGSGSQPQRARGRRGTHRRPRTAPGAPLHPRRSPADSTSPAGRCRGYGPAAEAPAGRSAGQARRREEGARTYVGQRCDRSN